MLDPALVTQARACREAPFVRDAAADRHASAEAVAASFRLEGIDASVEDVLAAADAHAPISYASAS